MQTIQIQIYPLIISFFLTYFSIPSIIKFSKKKGLLDFPNNRKLHKSPTVRLGGLSIFIGLYSSLLIGFILDIFPQKNILDINIILAFLLGGFLFFCLGFIEDLKSLSPFLRLTLQFIFSFILWLQGLKIEGLNLSIADTTFFDYSISNALSIPLTCFFIVAIINAFNWMDGLDGLASGVAIILFISLTFFENNNIFLISSLIGSSSAFLIFNIRGSTIMMGDGGSYLLGLFISLMTIYASYSNDFKTHIKSINIAVPFFLLLVPLLDMARVMFIRLINGRSIFYPDNKHLHHIFLKSGFGKIKSVLIILILILFFSYLGIIFTS